MSRASSVIVNNQTLAAAVTPGTLVTETNLSTNVWSRVAFELDITNASTTTVQGREIILAYVFSDTDLSTAYATAPSVFTSVSYFPMRIGGVASAKQISVSPAVNVTGDYLYTWIIIRETLGQPVALTLTVIDNSNTGVAAAS